MTAIFKGVRHYKHKKELCVLQIHANYFLCLLSQCSVKKIAK
jgi:hypothetical protein